MEEAKKPNVPDHEQLKRDLTSVFDNSKTYLGSFVKQEIWNFNFKQIGRRVPKPTQVRKYDYIVVQQGVKTRPAVIIKVLKDRTVIYCPVSSTENIHCLTPFKSRFLGEGCFTKTISVCTEEYAIDNFCGVFDDVRAVNRAIKELKEFINNSI